MNTFKLQNNYKRSRHSNLYPNALPFYPVRWENKQCSTLNPGRVKYSNLDLNSRYVGISNESVHQTKLDDESLDIFPRAIDLSTHALSGICSIMKQNEKQYENLDKSKCVLNSILTET